jgi:hypothetical protein
MIVFACIIIACALLNRVRGGGFGGQYLPGRALLWVAPAVAALAWTIHSWPVALAFGLGYLAWGLPSWGHTLARLGGYTPGREASWLERTFEGIWPRVAVSIRMMFVLPGVAAVAWLIGDWRFLAAAPAFAAAATAVYVILFRPIGSHDWMRAEIATGALWGLLLTTPAFLKNWSIP